jgi:hypothetical protein
MPFVKCAVCDCWKHPLLAVTDVTMLPLTFLITDGDQASLYPPLPGVFVVSDKPGPFRSASLSLYVYIFFFHSRSR